jgi:zinc protease
MKINRPLLEINVCILCLAILILRGSSASAEDVRLKLFSTGAEAKTGGFAPQHLDLSAFRPAGIKAVPAGLAAPLYGAHTLGPREAPGTYYFIVDEPAGRPARLFVDVNGNGDFTDDPPVEWIPESAGRADDGRQYTNYSGTATLKVAYGSNAADLGLEFYRFDKSDPRRADSRNWLYYYGDYFRSGEVTLGNKTFAALLGDTRTTGDFRPEAGTNKPSTTLFLDLNGDGKFARRAEAFFPGTPFNIGGTTYELTNFSASGDFFQIATSAQTVDETRPLPNLTAGHPALAFEATTTDGNAVKFPAAYHGKVVLLDFWATWCGPCVAELPNVVAAYEKYHDRGFEVLGVSFDRTNAAAKLASFTKDHHAPWPQIYEGRYWQTTIGTQYAIDSIPHAFLVDGTTGNILAEGEDLRGEKLEPAIAQALGIKPEPAAPRKVASVEGITEYQFENGLRVLLFPDPSQSKVTVNLTVLVGSRQEGYGETGMAHLLEHMAFKGTPRHQKIPKALQDHGAQFNGSTSSDRVNYFETLAATDENLDFAIDLEADRLVNSYIKGEDLDSEMTVVRNEFERGENSPGNLLEKHIAAAAYNWHNYGKPTIGNRSDIEHVPIANLQAFYRKYYQPDNVILIVAGKFEEARALELVQKYFAGIPRPARQLNTTYTEEPPQDGERSVVVRRVGDIGIVSAAYHIPSGSHEENAALEVLANILRTQPSGRLYHALVETKKATSASADAGAEHDPGLFSVDAEVPRENSLDDASAVLLATVESIGSTGVTDEEVARAKQQILKARELAANDTSRIAVALSEWAAQGDWRLYFLNRDRVEKVTPAEVQAVAARYLQRNNRTVGLFIPTEKPGLVPVPAAPDLPTLLADYKGRAAIAQGEVFEATPENIAARVQRLTLPEGVKVTLLPKKTRGAEVRLLLTLHYGNETNLKGMDAAAGLLPELLLRGTRKLTYQQLRDALDQLDAEIVAGSPAGRGGPRGGGGLGEITFSVVAKRDTLPAVLEIFRQVLREPALPEDQFELLKRERISGLEQQRTEPTALAPRALQRQLNPYPLDDVRYVPTVDELLARLHNATHDQVVRLYNDYLGSQAGELTIVGDFDTETNLAILKTALAGWKAVQPFARIVSAVPPGLAGGHSEIDTPDKANATYVAGELFALRDDSADYPALLIGNYILGSSALSSRLGDRIRQREGLSYGVNSGLNVSSWDQRAALTISAISNPKNVPRVDVAAREELERLLRDGVKPEELDKAKAGYLQSRQIGRANDQALAGLLSQLSYHDRTIAFEAELDRNIRALTPEQIRLALNKYIDPKALYVVTAGDFNTNSAPAAAGSAGKPN